MAKKRIITGNDYNFELVGIITSQRDYSLALYLNEILNISFTKVDEDLLPQKFSLYKSSFNNKFIFLVENKIPDDCFLSELKKFDFILKVPDILCLNKEIKPKLVSSNDYIFSGILDKSKLKKNTMKIISQIEI